MQKQVVLKKVGDRYMSGINSLVLEMEDSAQVFREKGLKEIALGQMPRIDEQFIIEQHPELEGELKSGLLKIHPTQMEAWQNNHGDQVRVYDYEVVRNRPKIQEQYVLEQERVTPRRTRLLGIVPSLPAVDIASVTQSYLQERERMQDLVARNRSRGSLRDFLSSIGENWHDPTYIIEERVPGRLRQVVLEILNGLLEETTIAAGIARGQDSRKFKESVKELARMRGISEPVVREHLEAKVRKLKDKLLTNKTPTYWTEDVYSKREMPIRAVS